MWCAWRVVSVSRRVWPSLGEPEGGWVWLGVSAGEWCDTPRHARVRVHFRKLFLPHDSAEVWGVSVGYVARMTCGLCGPHDMIGSSPPSERRRRSGSVATAGVRIPVRMNNRQRSSA